MATSVAGQDLGPAEHIVYSDDRVEVGAFRCPLGRPDFRYAGQIRSHAAFVFPRSAVWIRHEGQRAFAADPGVVTLYNPGQPFTREPLDDRGDFCDWFAVEAETAAEVARELDPEVADHPRRPFRFSHGPTDAATYLQQRQLFQALAAVRPIDALEVEERVVELLRRVLWRCHAAWRPGALVRRRASGRDEREAAQEARRVLAQRFRDPILLSEVARAVGLSRYRLCRVFRQATGTTLHDYREQLRLRHALAALAEGRADLTGLALDLGYSSHSHFSANFRCVFGVTPSRARARLAVAAVARIRDINDVCGRAAVTTAGKGSAVLA